MKPTQQRNGFLPSGTTGHSRPSRLRPASRRSLAASWLLLALILAGPNVSTADEPACDDQGASLRLLTYNVAKIATFDSNEDAFGMDDTVRAKRIVAGILRGDNDVVALNEVFKDDAKWVYYKGLRERFPHVIFELRESDLDQDSGLMLFSRFPFRPLSGPGVMEGSVTAVSGGQLQLSVFGIEGDNWTDVSYTVFDGRACSGDDCWADKGAALVRIENPCTDLVENVVFTHMQASYGSDNEEKQLLRQENRSIQLLRIQQMIAKSLTDHEQQTESVYLMGDLNISGDPDRESPDTAATLSEWRQRFSNEPEVISLFGERFTACGTGPCTWDPLTGSGSYLIDTWHFETSPDDPGETTRSEGRLDYILRNDPVLPPLQPTGSTQLCAQHLRVAYELDDQDGWERYSDHLGVGGDFNRRADHCDAVNARAVAFPDRTAADATHHLRFDGRITFPGSMQWYQLPTPGTYSIQSSSPVDFEVYRHTDLSQPIRSRGVDAERGQRFAVTEGPLYVRVFASTGGVPDRSWQGPYTIDFHRHSCNRPTDDCSLPPASRQPAVWGVGPVNEEDALWMSFETETSEQGLFPTIELIVSRPEEIAIEAEIVSDTLTETFPIVDREDLDVDGDGTTDSLRLTLGDLEGLPGGGRRKYFVRIVPERDRDVALALEVELRTNLTYLYPRLLRCEVQNDTFGDDEIYALIEVDAALPTAVTSLVPGMIFLGDFDDDSADKAVTVLGPRRFVDSAVINLIEDDDGFNGDDDYLEPMWDYEDRLPSPDPIQLAPLDPASPRTVGVFRWSDIPVPGLAVPPLLTHDYSYRLQFLLTHEPE